MNELAFDLTMFAAAVAAGTLGAMIGLGGGIVITPVLVLFFHIDIRYAMGAALASVIATSSGAAAAYLRDGISNMRIGLFLCIATTLGAVGGAMLAGISDPQWLSLIFGFALLATAGLSLRKQTDAGDAALPVDPVAARLRLDDALPTPAGPQPYHVQRVGWGFLVMIVAGVLSGLLGIGSGAFKVLGMDQIMRIPFKVTTTTSNFMIGVTAAASIGIYLKNGYLDPVLVFPVALGVLAGAFLGARLLTVVPVNLLKAVFLIAIVAVGIEMILRGLNLGLA
ncbi:MAG: sulfite exporter TauE/SafE family protein [Terrimicrobiaceae bacterium]|nr:sulfite exporter TauE/SafE family protein [Terrimicrobiaceae bacterium]